MRDKERQIKLLRAGLAAQQAIFNKHAPRAINPDNSKAYTIAKKAFDLADRRIKEINKELARLICEESPKIHPPSIFDEKFPYVKESSNKVKITKKGVATEKG